MSRYYSFTAALFAVLVATTTAFGQNATWNGGAGDYHTGSNWSGGVVPDGAGFDVFIDGGNGVSSVVDTSTSTSTMVDSVTIDLGDIFQMTNNSDFFVGSLIQNDGEFRITTVGNATDLILSGDVDLLGTGSLTLTSSATRVLGGGHLTNFGNTIQGWGTLGNNDLQFTNNAGGFVEANVDSLTLTVDPNANGIVNEGTFLASSGGNLLLTDASVNNASGTIEALAGSTVTISNTDVTGGLWITAGDGTIEIPNNASVTASDMTNLATINQNNNTNFNLNGTIDNQAVINVTTLGNASDIQINNLTTLEGGGTITLGGSPCRILDPSGSDGELTNVDNLLQGEGQIGVNNLHFINEPAGTIDANDPSGNLTIDPPTGSPMINMGVMQASNGGELNFQSGEFINAGALIEANNDSTLTLNGGVSVFNGTMRSQGSGTIEIPNNAGVTLTDLTIEGTVNQGNNTQLFLVGSIDNQAEFNLNTLGNGTDIVIGNAVTLSGGSTITMGGNSDACRILDNSGADGILTNVDHLIQGKGQIGVNNLLFINQVDGVINANDATGLITLDPRTSDPMVNRGLIKASNGGALNLNSGEYDNQNSLILAESGTTMTLNGGVSVFNGTLRSQGSGTIEIPNNVGVMLTDLTIEGTVNQGNNANLLLVGSIVNQADININSLGNASDVVFNSSVLVAGSGTINLLHPVTRFEGSGDLEMIDGTVNGIGQINLDSLFRQNATVAPGLSSGTLTFNGNHRAQFVDGGAIEIEVGALTGTPGADWDILDVNGTLDFDHDVLESGATIKLKSLDTNGDPGELDGFDQGTDYSWLIADCTAIEGFSSSFVVVDTSEFENNSCGIFTVTQTGNQLFLNYLSQVVSVNSDDLNVLRGFVLDGDITETFASDDQYLQYNPGITLNANEPPVWLEFEGTLPDSAPQWLNIKLESHANTPGIIQTVEMFNWVTDEYEMVDSRATSWNVDATANIAVPIPMEFVEAGTNTVRARTGWKSGGGPLLLFPWTVSIDYVVWLLQ